MLIDRIDIYIDRQLNKVMNKLTLFKYHRSLLNLRVKVQLESRDLLFRFKQMFRIKCCFRTKLHFYCYFS